MPKMTVGFAMILLVIGNLIAVFSDALIKSLPDDSAVYQFVFFRQLSAVLILFPLCHFLGNKNLFQDLKWHLIRGHIWLFGAIFMVISLNALPLATANAIFYAAPLLMLPLAMLLFKEKLTRQTIWVSIFGFIGVLIVVQPTHISWAAISALIVAFTLASNNILIRKLPKQHSILQTLLLTNLVGIPAALCLAMWEGKPWHWEPIVTATGSTSFILIYAGICIFVYRSVEASKVASAEYSGLLGAVGVGLLFFNEIPEMSMLIGTLFIILPLIWLARFEAKKRYLVSQTKSE
ncbi:transporter [Psychromonas sp. CNPT3]|uniref:DMT family transporter n=1 Tax=Psychromonas sp. CNPT3 TaxID=314282 RepID=UPI00006E70E4|nr:DMT family transporter [Psychromonas sp. CNPT3]AGH81483.1 transporter [Psychromonas sp. CNPT3]